MFLNVKIKEARLERKMTQQQLANELTLLNRKTTNTAVANWESGLNSPDVDTLELICKILNKDGNYFFDINNNTNNIKYDIDTLQHLENYNKLNDLGKQAADIYVEDLTTMAKYTEVKKETNQVNG